MNTLSQVRKTQAASEREDAKGLSSSTSSWHSRYAHSAYVFAGGLPFALTEGDVLAIFSQFGEIVDINLVRDRSTGKSRGFAFLAYEDQRSTVLAVDNLNGATAAGRTIRVEHVNDYKLKREQVEGKDAVASAMQRNAQRITNERSTQNDRTDDGATIAGKGSAAAEVAGKEHGDEASDAYVQYASGTGATSSEDETIRQLKRRRENADAVARRRAEQDDTSAADGDEDHSWDEKRLKVQQKRQRHQHDRRDRHSPKERHPRERRDR
jgi:RNA-binding motif X-linked protein 2